MLNYMEEKTYLEAHHALHQTQLHVNYRFQVNEAMLAAAGGISEEERNEGLDYLLERYDQEMRQAEAEYDKVMDKIRPWKKIRRER